jgi:hypothetical protein
MADKKVTYNFKPISLPTILFSLPTAMIGYQIHSSTFWAIMDFIFWPIVWIKWFIFHEVTLSIIKEAFSWFLK